MSRKILFGGLVASVALHVWLIWPPSRPATPSPTADPEAPPARVAMREVPPERSAPPKPSDSARPKEQPTQPPHAPPQPDAQPEVPSEPEQASSAVATLAASAPAAEPASAPEAAPAAPAPSTASVQPAQVAESAPDSGPAPIHAPPGATEAVIMGDEADSVGDRGEPAPDLPELAPVAAPIPASIPVPAPVAASPRAAATTPVPPPAVQPAAIAPQPRPTPRPLALPWLSRRTSPTAATAPRASIAAAPSAAAAPPAPSSAMGAASQPMSAALRAPQPYRPISTSWRPGRPGAVSAKAGGAQASDRGPAGSASAQPPSDPVARIAWGTPEEAMRTLDQGRLMLVRVDERLSIVGALERSGGAWRRAAALPSLSPYSNRVRVVDHVAAFASIAGLCGPGEHLAVVVPVGLERKIDRAMGDAASRAGMLRSTVAACYGRLVPSQAGLEFVIDRVEARANP